jgi:hypothetical protein
MGKIHYDPINATGCKEYDKNDELHFTRTNDVTPFMVALRGECSFVQKARNMENIGVAVSIVVDDHAESIKSVLMGDDGTGGGIRIPSMLISKPDGEKILEWFTKATEEERE